jgi:putative RecB family exonuclease
MSQFDVAAVFREELDKAVADEVRRSGFPVEEWFWSGPRSAAQALALLADETGPEMVQAFIDWWEHNPDLEIWHTPDGVPAIELPIEVMFGSVPVKMILDLVLQIGTALVVVDWKTSAKLPANNRQLGIYACGLELKYGTRPRYGTWFMNRGTGPKAGPKTFFQRPIELDRPQYSIAYLAREFEQFEQGIQAGVFPASPGEHCGRCGVAYACTEVGGAKARELDQNYPQRERA